jgi:membrane protease YdiL (CAAX protease family)
MIQYAFFLLIFFYFAFASKVFIQGIKRLQRTSWYGLIFLAVLLVPFMLATAENTEAMQHGLPVMAAYIFFPGVVLILRPRRNRALDLYDLVAVFSLWVPVELDWLPEDTIPTLLGFDLPVALLTAICLGLLLFLVIRPLEGIGYTYRLSLKNLGAAGLAVGVFAIIGIPLGLGLGFIKIKTAAFSVTDWVLRFLVIYFLNALPEELLFRGVVQNLVERRFGRGWQTLLVSAIFFGFTHINNTTAFHSPPNYAYVVMASIAGVAYGWVWRRSGKITASAITHTLVNFIWSVLFLS